LLKSTLLQLDSTFSEREYGAGSFRDFMEKVAQTGAVTLKNAGRSMMVESREDGDVDVAPSQAQPEHEASVHTRPQADGVGRVLSDPAAQDDDETMPASPMTMQDGIRAVQQAFGQASPAPRWPMYVRQAKQFLKTNIEGFDERKYGFASVVDLLRAAGKEGVLKLERDRHGAFRVFAGARLMASPAPVEVEETSVDVTGEVVTEGLPVTDAEAVEEPPIVDAQPIESPEPAVVEMDGEVIAPAKRIARKRKAAASRAKAAKGEKGEKAAERPRARKGSPLDSARGKRSKSEAADR
jgi:hypothetical protein